ncbi:conserved unknown protein [Ectocarpus siliculosus]|uniref:Ferredoxin n=1 Tax=Ectocarpus siliculosus TaxID=2880 RepID=D7G5N8_ECTSI|nr:conserved unknown protein [Ectocarpus siliculosus]|eukprot:CBJ27335.1 conserved unknown protein [Ectocarpus siliculosus]
MKRRHATSPLLTLACALAWCGLCGAFVPPPAGTTTAWRQQAPLPPSAAGTRRRCGGGGAASAVRMQQGSGSDQELQVAVSKLAGQVEELTAMVAQLAAEPGGNAGAAKAINGGVVDGGSALPVVSTKAKGGSTPLVSTSAAQQRIDQWLRESGGEAASAPVAEAPPVATAPAAVVAAPPAAVPEVAAPPAEAPPADAPPAGSGYKVKIEWEGAIHEVNCDAETTLLEAAMDAGLELPSSCMSGSCLTCPGKIVSGSVDQSEGVLEDEQKDAGFLLTCISYPESDVHFAVVDEEDLPEA